MKRLVFLLMISVFFVQLDGMAQTKKSSTKKTTTTTTVKKDADKKGTVTKKTTTSTTTKKGNTTTKTTSTKPKTKGKVIGYYNQKTVYQGPKGGKYYLTKSGNKSYLKKEQYSKITKSK